MRAFGDAAARVAPVDQMAAAKARQLHDRLLKPPGSLGALETLGVRLAAMAGECPPPLPDPAHVVVFAGDHGVHAQGVTPWPQEITRHMVRAFAGGKAAVCVLARQVGASLGVVDVGVVGGVVGGPGVERRTVRPGTADLTVAPAMTREEARAALDVGADVAAARMAAGARCLVGGEMGIANTTSSSALLALLLDRDPAEVTGRGTGIDDAMLATKVGAVRRGVERARRVSGGPPGPLDALAEVGGLEIAALAGFMVGGAAARVPVVVDGFIAGTAACVAEALAPGTQHFMVAGHRSAEPGAGVALAHLDLDPVLDLGMRLGEGTGALLALPLLRAAAAVLREMGTLEDLDRS